ERGRGGELVIESTDRQVSLECRIPATIEVVGAEKGTGEDEVIYLPSISYPVLRGFPPGELRIIIRHDDKTIEFTHEERGVSYRLPKTLQVLPPPPDISPNRRIVLDPFRCEAIRAATKTVYPPETATFRSSPLAHSVYLHFDGKNLLIGGVQPVALFLALFDDEGVEKEGGSDSFYFFVPYYAAVALVRAFLIFSGRRTGVEEEEVEEDVEGEGQRRTEEEALRPQEKETGAPPPTFLAEIEDGEEKDEPYAVGRLIRVTCPQRGFRMISSAVEIRRSPFDLRALVPDPDLCIYLPVAALKEALSRLTALRKDVPIFFTFNPESSVLHLRTKEHGIEGHEEIWVEEVEDKRVEEKGSEYTIAANAEVLQQGLAALSSLSQTEDTYSLGFVNSGQRPIITFPRAIEKGKGLSYPLHLITPIKGG
ncbi:MAG: hypothetical protein QXH08_03475, partial [Candidatus Hadarchaeales archaeon]